MKTSDATRNTDLTIVIPALREAENLSVLLPEIHEVIKQIGIETEIIVIDELADERTRQVVAGNQAKLISPPTRGYGNALRAGLKLAQGDYVITMDADQSHPPELIKDLWENRKSADVLIASRYIPGGSADMSFFRLMLSKTLNFFFGRGLGLLVKDISSGYRLYARQAIPSQSLTGVDFNILQELLIRVLYEGYQIKEIPFRYLPRQQGLSHARIIPFGFTYLKTFRKLWLVRNSIHCADYDARGYITWFIPQRYWQRRRYKIIIQMIQGKGKCLDIGCGSSRILSALPQGSVGLDVLLRKLRFARLYGRLLIQGSAFHLPVQDQSFSCVICSQVIEHLPGKGAFNELDRVLSPGGSLILGTPDYGKKVWKIIEWLYKKILPQAKEDKHISQYTYQDLIQELVERRGYSLQAHRYILQGELIMHFQKPKS